MPNNDDIFYSYEKYDDEGNIQFCPANDYDASVTGQYVFGVKLWFDENPDERIARGWIKHIQPTPKQAGIDYNPQTQNIFKVENWIDDYTFVDSYYTKDKSEDQMLLETMLESIGMVFPTGKVILDNHGGVIV